MAFVLADRVRETTDTNGTGAIRVTGVVPGGYQTFNSVLSNGDTTLCLVRNDAGQWQTFLGTWNSATQSLARTTAYESSEGAGVNVGFSGEAQEVWINYPAAKYRAPKFENVVIGGANYSTNTAPRLFTVFEDQTLSGTSSVITRIGSILRGTQTAASSGSFITAVDEDRVAMSDTNASMSLVANFDTLRAGWSGGRTLAADILYVGNPSLPGTSSQGTAGVSAYHVSGSSFAYSYTDAGGVPGAERGNLFGRNDGTRIREGSGPHWNSTFGNETDVGIEADQMALWKGGIKVVQWSTDRVRGLIQDYAYGVNNQANTSTPGWRTGFALGGFEGYWPFRTDSTIMKKIDANGGAGNATEAGAGIDLRGITFGESAFASGGFRVDGSGNLGALTAGGVALQTRSAINAKTAVVNTITVIEGGLFSAPVTLTLSAPTTSGTTATATVATYSMQAVGGISTGGTDHVVGETFTVSGGTSSVAATGVVTHVNGTGGVTGVRITNAGTNSYSALPSNPVSVTMSAAGTGFTFTPYVSVLTVTVSGAGTNYSEFLPPTVTSAGSTTYRPATFKVMMTAAAAPILFGDAYANYASFTGAAATGVFDTGAPVLQAAGSDTNVDFKVLGKGAGRLNSTKLYVGTTGARSAVDDLTATYLRTGVVYSTTGPAGLRVGGNFSGAVTSGDAFYHQFAVDADTVDPTGTGPGGTTGFAFAHTVSAGAKGGRTALGCQINVLGAITAGTGTTSAFIVAMGGSANAFASAGGTNTGAGSRGNLFGSNPRASLKSGATNWSSVVGSEVGFGIWSGASARYKVGFQVIQDDLSSQAGAEWEAMFALGNQTNALAIGMEQGITFGINHAAWPISATGTMIASRLGAVDVSTQNQMKAAHGIDFATHPVYFSDSSLNLPGLSVSGSGDVTIGPNVISWSADGIEIAAEGSVGTLSAVAAGGSNFTVGDLAFDPHGGLYEVATLSGSAIASLTTLRSPTATGATPSNPVALTAIRGTGATINLTWATAPKINLIGQINVSGLPTSSAGLDPGDLWLNAGVLTAA